MGLSKRYWKAVFMSGGLGYALAGHLLAQDSRPASGTMPGSEPGTIQLVGVPDPEKKGAEPTPAPAPSPVAQPPTPSAASATPSFSPGGGAAGTAAAAGATPSQQATAALPSGGVATQGEAQVRQTTDVGDLLNKSLGSVGVEVQRRSPIITDPRIRGMRQGQIYTQADGGYFFPVRPDLDTIVSKLNSTSIASSVVVKGPYTVRYGPAFAFIDVETLATPRYRCFEYHGSTFLSYKTNGDQWNGMQSVWGGGQDYGFRLSWDALAGNDYRTGGGFDIPSSYNSQNFNAAFGFDLDEKNHVEIRTLRLMQRDTEVPGVITDINKLTTDAYNLRYVSEDQPMFDRFVLDAFYNETRFSGDNFREGKRRSIPFLDRFQVLTVTPPGQIPGPNDPRPNPPLPPGRLFTETNGDASTWGGRALTTWGKEADSQLNMGADFRYLSQSINEFNTLFIPGTQSITTNQPLPRSRWFDPGVFLDVAVPAGCAMTLRGGVRADYVSARLQQPVSNPRLLGPNEFDFLLGPGSLGPTAFDEQNYFLFSGFAVAEYKASEQLTTTFGYGYGQRAPTLVELYADRIFLALLQNGFSSYRGNPDLEKEQMHQINLGVRGDYENVRLQANGFAGWARDYITFRNEGFFGTSDPNITRFQFVNTDEAMLAGAEFYGEVDVVEWLTPFASLAYTYGHDVTRSEPLPTIPPLNTHVGFRIHDPGKQPRWAVEFDTRMVARQGRNAASLLEDPTSGFTIFNLRGYWQMTESFLLTAGVENIGDRLYREHLDLRTGTESGGRGVFQPGVNFYVGARLTY